MDAKRLIDILELRDDNVRSYSGRGMYGKQCVSVVGSDTQTLFAEIVRAFLEATESGLSVLSELPELIESARSDDMGLGVVVYWPRIKWEDTEDGRE